MFNEIRMYQGQPVRLWSAPHRALGQGRYVIFPNGRMIHLRHFEIAYLPAAPAEAAAMAFPVQDLGQPGERM